MVKVLVSNTCSSPERIFASISASFSAVPGAAMDSFRSVMTTAPMSIPWHHSWSKLSPLATASMTYSK